MNVHHHADRVRDYMAEANLPLPVHVFEEAELLGTAGALLPMRRLLTEPFVLLYGDVVTDIAFTYGTAGRLLQHAQFQLAAKLLSTHSE